MKHIGSLLGGLLLLSPLVAAQVELVHYDFVGPVDELNAPVTTLAPGITASDLVLVGATPLSISDDTFSGDGWSNSVGPDLAQYVEFSVTGAWPAGEIRHDWFLSSFGPLDVTVRSSLDGFVSDIATDSRPPGAAPATDFQASLDISVLGNLTSTTVFRLYFHGGSDGGNPTFNTLFIDGSGFGFGDIGLKVFDGSGGPPNSLCNGDGGNQTGCTACPCGNDAPPGTIGGCLNRAGTSAQIASSGDTSASTLPGVTTDLRFTLKSAPPGAFCVMLSGSAIAPTNLMSPCIGLNSGVQSPDRDGLRCAVMNLKRHGGRSANGAGEIMDSSGPSRVWGGEAQPNGGIWKQGGFVAGQTRYFQVTFREDPMTVCQRGLNTSQALEILFTP